MNNLVEQMELYLSNLKQLSETDPNKARQISRQHLIQTGIIDKEGNICPPYNGEKVNEIDFTMGPNEIQYTKRRITNAKQNRRKGN